MPRVSRFSHFFLFSVALAAVTVFSVGCGSSSSSSSGTKIRFVNASPDQATVNVLIDGTTVATALANGGAATAYLGVASGARHIQIQDPATSSNIIDTTPTISSGYTTYIIKDFKGGSISVPLILTDDNSTPASGDFKIRAINLAPNLNNGTDVYVEPSTTSTLSGLTPTFSGLPFPPATATYVSTAVGTGSWEVVFTPAGSQGILAGGTAATYVAGQVETVLIVEDTSGAYTEVSLVDVQ